MRLSLEQTKGGRSAFLSNKANEDFEPLDKGRLSLDHWSLATERTQESRDKKNKQNMKKNKQNQPMRNMNIDTYRLTSMEEPSDEVLAQLMREAAEDAKHKRAEATARFFGQLKKDAQKISVTW